MEKKLFSLKTFQVDSATPTALADEIKFFIDRGDKFWFESWAKAYGYRHMPSNETVLEAVLIATGDPKSIYKPREKLHRWQADAMSLEPVIKNRKSSAQLYEELKKKVLS